MEKQNPSRPFDRFDIQNVAKTEFDLLIGEKLARAFLIMHKDKIEYAMLQGGYEAARVWVKNRLAKCGREDFDKCLYLWRR